jgi:hypothetical protein
MKRCVLPTPKLDSPMLSVIAWAFDAVWEDIDLHADAPSRERARSVVLNALMDLAAAGERDPIRLWEKAKVQARTALA